MLQNDAYYCVHIDALKNDAQELANFAVKVPSGEGLVNYIQRFALRDEEAGLMRTYLVKDRRSSEIAGYFSLKAGLISLNEIKTESGVVFDTLPGVELANFAVNDSYMRKHPEVKNIGSLIFSEFIRPIIADVAERVGVRLIYIFALPNEKLLQAYGERYGFVRLDSASEAELHQRLKPQYDEGCIFMYQLL